MVGKPKKKFDKINFIYRDEKGIHSSYMYFRGLKTALERNKLLYYAYDVHSAISPDMDALLKYPILCITGSQEPIFDLVNIINQKQFIAEINSESLDTRQGDLRQDLYLPVKERSKHFHIYFTPFEIDLDRYWGKPCYWLPSWVHTEVLDEITDPVFDKLGFVGRRWRREEFFLQDKNKIILAQNTIPKNDAYENAAELCKLINKFKILVNPVSSISLGMTGKTWEYLACKRMCLCYLNESWMFKTKKLFKSNKDIVYFKSFEEMEAQYNYFIKRPEKLKDIALSGYHIVRQFHNADERAKRLAKIVLHHANGGRVKPEWNSIGSIMPVKTRNEFYLKKNHPKSPLGSEIGIPVDIDHIKVPVSTQTESKIDLPEIFTIETTLACNLQCPECAIGRNLIVRPKSYMNLEQFKIIAEKIQPFVKLCYLFNWGEPLLNPDILKIIKHSSEKFNANLCVSTNGILVNDKSARELIASGISTIIVSIDGITQAIYEKYRKKGDLKKALAGLEMLQRHNLKLGNRVEILPQFIVFKHNQHEMEGFKSHCTSIGLRPLFKSPYLRNESEFENSDYPEFIRNQYPDINSLRQAMKDCPDARNSFVINSDGAVVGCCYDHNGCSPYGNIYKQDVIEIWNGAEFKKFRERVLGGNAPKFCVENCLYYVVDNSCGKETINNSCGKKNSQMPSYKVHQGQIRDPLFDFPTPPDKKNILKRNNIQKRKKINFSIAFLTTYYDGFIKKFYKEKPELANGYYDLQLSEILDQSFGDSDFYAEGMKSAGWKAADYIMNCQPLQKMWAKERQIKGSEVEIICEQIRNSQPDVLYCQDMNVMPEKFFAAVRKYTKLVVGQIATPIRTQIPFHCYDIVFSSFPHYVERFRKSGVTTYYQPLAFENRILDKIQAVEFSNRKYPCVFVGGISNLHIESYKLLDALARMTPIEFWGYGVETTANDSQVHMRHHGEAWGLEMFNILASSKIIINRHGEVAENYANNMRLFEATGCGALLITDYKDNLNELFKVGEEIVAYRSTEECVALVKYYLSNPGEAAQIARAGQNRTLCDHTYLKRMYKSAEILERHLRYKEEKNIYPVIKQISYGHKPIQKDMLTENLSMAWKDTSIPVKQRAVVQNELTGMYRGHPPNVYQVLADCLFSIALSECTILEIGCASGYYYEALEYLLNKQLNYTGVDYSEPLIVMAKDLYPNTTFYVADGVQLPFVDKKFFISISSGMLLHVPNYIEHIKEAVRVSARYIIAHRTPVCRRQKTQHLKKFAYGVETVELIFNEEEIISEFQLQGLKLLQANEYYSNHNKDHYEVTYLFEKEDRFKSHTIRERDRSDTIARPRKSKKPKMLNLGCGGRYHKDWINIDFHSSGPDVIKHNLCLGIPSPNEDFDVVYHSDILEHFPKSYAPEFLKECWRVLKPGGIIRVVQPDLEQIVRLYLDALDRSLHGDQEAQKRYEWLVIELLDQMVRNRSGGEMLEYWKQTPMPAEDFVIERCGSEVLGALQYLRAKPQPVRCNEDPYLKAIRNNDGSQIKKMSLFRMSGEVHQWMYDRYSLKKILGETGFVDIQQCCADQSEIPDFNSYLLDIEPNGNVRKPDSFFMEAWKQPKSERKCRRL